VIKLPSTIIATAASKVRKKKR